MRFLIILFMITFLLAPPLRAEGPEIKVALSYDMINGLPDNAQCLERVRSVFPNLKIEDIPWKRIMLNLEYGYSDLTPCVFKTPAREKFTDLFGPIAYLPIIMVYSEYRDLALDDIKPLKGVFLRGTSLIKQYTRPEMQVLEVNHIENILEMIKRDRADYSLMPANFVTNRDTDGLRVKTIDHMALYIGVSKKSKRREEIMQTLQDEIDFQDYPINQ